MGLLKVDDQLERRPVAILQTAHFGGRFQKKSAGGGSNPSAPTTFQSIHEYLDVRLTSAMYEGV